MIFYASKTEHENTGAMSRKLSRLGFFGGCLKMPSCSVSTVPNKKASTLQRWLRIGHFAGDDKLRK